MNFIRNQREIKADHGVVGFMGIKLGQLGP